ncbi:hypothetical protein DITRI_Ditri03aG0083500 [Diplodiscus trichospermus]
MERSSIDEEETDDQKLHLLLKNLEQEWNFIKKRPEKTQYRSSTGSSSKMVKTLGLLDNSPRKLMSSLQHITSPASEEVAWKVRTNDLAVEEILKERRAAIESGKLKGRRLFEEEDGVTDQVGFGSDQVQTSSGLEIGLVQESEVRSVFSYESDNYEDENWGRKEVLCPSCPHCSSSSSSPHDENVERGGTEVATLAEKRIAGDVCSGTSGRWRVVEVWLVIVLVVCIVGIISGWSFGIYEDEDEWIDDDDDDDDETGRSSSRMLPVYAASTMQSDIEMADDRILRKRAEKEKGQLGFGCIYMQLVKVQHDH